MNRLLELIATSCGVETDPVYEPERPGDVQRSEADQELALTLGYEPKVEVSDGLRRTVDWFRGRA